MIKKYFLRLYYYFLFYMEKHAHESNFARMCFKKASRQLKRQSKLMVKELMVEEMERNNDVRLANMIAQEIEESKPNLFIPWVAVLLILIGASILTGTWLGTLIGIVVGIPWGPNGCLIVGLIGGIINYFLK